MLTVFRIIRFRNKTLAVRFELFAELKQATLGKKAKSTKIPPRFPLKQSPLPEPHSGLSVTKEMGLTIFRHCHSIFFLKKNSEIAVGVVAAKCRYFRDG